MAQHSGNDVFLNSIRMSKTRSGTLEEQGARLTDVRLGVLHELWATDGARTLKAQ